MQVANSICLNGDTFKVGNIDPLVRTQSFHCWGPGSIPVGELRSHKPCMAKINK